MLTVMKMKNGSGGSATPKRGGCLRTLLIAFGLLVLLGALISSCGGDKQAETSSTTTPPATKATSEPTKQPAASQAEATTEAAEATETTQATEETTQAAEPAVPTEYLSALVKAESYSEMMHMSKKGLYQQLTSDAGEKFSPKAAQYAIDHIKADWKANALAKAKDYQEQMSMSPEAIRDQLTSEAGEQFTQAEADYAIAHLS